VLKAGLQLATFASEGMEIINPQSAKICLTSVVCVLDHSICEKSITFAAKLLFYEKYWICLFSTCVDGFWGLQPSEEVGQSETALRCGGIYLACLFQRASF
jgi:hypothetical protein